MPTEEEKKEFEQSRYFVFHKTLPFTISFIFFFLLMAFFAFQPLLKITSIDNFMNTDLFFAIVAIIILVFGVLTIFVYILFLNKEYRENYINMVAYNAKYGKGQLPFIKKIDDPKKRFFANTILCVTIVILINYLMPIITSKLPSGSDQIMVIIASLCALLVVGVSIWMIVIGCKKPRNY